MATPLWPGTENLRTAMDRFLLPLLALCFILSCSKEAADSLSPAEEPAPTLVNAEAKGPYLQGISVVKFSDGLLALIEEDLDRGKVATRSMGLNQALDELGILSIKRVFPDAGEYEERTRREGLHKWYYIEYAPTFPLTRAAAELGSVPGIEHVEGQRKIKPLGFDDPRLGSQWGYINGKKAGADINVEFVWNYITTGSPDVVVSVVDGGIDQTHPDLADNLYGQNYNFVDYSPDIVAHRHGTHVAGTVAAVNNNGIGVCGVAGGDAKAGKPGVKLMSCQVFKSVTENGKTRDKAGSTAMAIKWGADHGAVISQNSWGYDYDDNGDGYLTGEELQDALNGTISVTDKLAVDYFIKYAGCDNGGEQLPDSPMKGGVVIFSAGNDAIQNGAPANYGPIISVGAIASNGSRASYSNFGTFVDICAPGTSVLSTLPGGNYGTLSGTSMACPHVSGVAALVVSYCGGRGFTNEMLKTKLLSGASNKAVPKIYSVGGLVDAAGAIVYGDGLAPAKAYDLQAEPVSNFIGLSWAVPSDAKGVPAYGFKVIYGTDKGTVDAADPASKPGEGVGYIDLRPMLPAGEKASCTLSDLSFSTAYYIKVVAYSYGLLYAEASDILTVGSVTNNPPEISTSYTGTTVFKAHETAVVPISVTDPDGHTFKVSYTRGSAADSFTEGDGMHIRIVGVDADPGTYTATVHAEDRYGAKTDFDFTYTILQNHPPKVVKEAGNLMLDPTGADFQMDLADYFSDEDGEPLEYAASLGDGSVASLDLRDGKAVVAPKKQGLTIATITASDAKGETAQASFKILVRDPSVKCSAYPNPVSKTLYLATGEEIRDTRVKVVSATGSIAYEGTVRASAFEPAAIDLSGCAPGKYSISVSFGSANHRQTIVKK